jgi:hypothetical protein
MLDSAYASFGAAPSSLIGRWVWRGKMAKTRLTSKRRNWLRVFSIRQAFAASLSPKRRDASPLSNETRATGDCRMFSHFRSRGLLTIAALAVAIVLGGCVAYPAYPGYGYNGGYYGAPYYAGPTVAFGGGWGWHGGGDWHR